MENRRFVALGDLIADCYYNGTKLIGIEGGSSRFNVIANLANMNCKNAVIGGCGNDKIGKTIFQRFENIGVDTSKKFFKDRKARAYHLTVNKDMLPKITYSCSKNSPKNGKSSWYEESLDDIPYCNNQVRDSDVIVLDTVDEFSLKVSNDFKCDKVLDIGNPNCLDKLQDNQILSLMNKIQILQLNERVVPYLMQRFECTNILDIYNLLKPKLMIVTHAKDGADFVWEDKVYRKKLLKSAKELDATGAGDAFFSVFIKKYYDNSKRVDYEFIDRTFEEAVTLTSEVVQHIGARGHLYEKKINKSVQKYGTKDDAEETSKL